MDKAIELIEAQIENIKQVLDSLSFEQAMIKIAVLAELQTLRTALKVEQVLIKVGA